LDATNGRWRVSQSSFVQQIFQDLSGGTPNLLVTVTLTAGIRADVRRNNGIVGQLNAFTQPSLTLAFNDVSTVQVGFQPTGQPGEFAEGVYSIRPL
jgi:hypothetical protein